jgi:hypothetical protein
METTRCIITGVIPTVAVLGYLSLGTQSSIMPPEKKYFAEPIAIETGLMAHHNPYYEVVENHDSMNSQIEIIHRFVSTLLENTQDLDPQFSKLVDEHFWELA